MASMRVNGSMLEDVSILEGPHLAFVGVAD